MSALPPITDVGRLIQVSISLSVIDELFTAETELHGRGVGSDCELDRVRRHVLELLEIVRDDCEVIDRELRPDPELELRPDPELPLND